MKRIKVYLPSDAQKRARNGLVSVLLTYNKNGQTLTV